jgi:hypothetical protein
MIILAQVVCYKWSGTGVAPSPPVLSATAEDAEVSSIREVYYGDCLVGRRPRLLQDFLEQVCSLSCCAIYSFAEYVNID